MNMSSLVGCCTLVIAAITPSISFAQKAEMPTAANFAVGDKSVIINKMHYFIECYNSINI